MGISEFFFKIKKISRVIIDTTISKRYGAHRYKLTQSLNYIKLANIPL